MSYLPFVFKHMKLTSFELSLVACAQVETVNTSTVMRMMCIELCVVGNFAYMITIKYHLYDICARPVVSALFVNTI